MTEPSDAPLRIAVCICTRNRPGALARALASIVRSRCAAAVTVVSDDSDDEMAGRVAEVCARAGTEVRYVRGPRRGLGANRNHALRAVLDVVDAVVFLDDDAELRPEFLGRAGALCADHGLRSVVTGCEMKGGQLIVPRNPTFLGHQERPIQSGRTMAVVINATIFPMAVFRQVQFDECLRYGYDEVDMAAQTVCSGFSIVWCADLVNDHFPAAANREEYRLVEEASRLYATYKRYRWVTRRPFVAGAYAMLGPAHCVVHGLLHGGIGGAVAGFGSVVRAASFVGVERVRRRGLTPPPNAKGGGGGASRSARLPFRGG